MLKVADIGSSKVSRLELEVEAPVVLEITPFDKVLGHDMEYLDCPSSYFDIVHCRNALDHTKNARKAIAEMIRICKPDGTTFIKCWLDQKDTGYKHYWNAKEDGTFTNGKESFSLQDFGFKIKFVKNGGERRYDYIEATRG